MLKRLMNNFFAARERQRIGIALSKGGSMMLARNIDLKHPASWEFSGFSQNGEDGILDVLRKQLRGSNRYFIEVGAADGIENNSAWLVVAERYNGLMIEGNARLVEAARRSVIGYSIGAECHQMFVTRDTIADLTSLAMHLDPDVFSLDIDGNDYHIAVALFAAGFRPKIFVVEYNSVYGPERSATIPYQADFEFSRAHPTKLYYGVSITAWRRLFARLGYRFITVDVNGVNGFFVDPVHFDAGFLDQVQGLAFAENRYQLTKFRMPVERQFALIADRAFVTVEDDRP
jgi:hypothetical protein